MSSVRSHRRRFLWWPVSAVAALGVMFITVSAYFSFRFTSPVRKPAGDFAPYLPPTTENIHFTANDGVSLSGWFVPREGATRAAILLHGNGSHRRHMLTRAKFLHAHGYAVLLYDARGHGESRGDRVSFGWFETRDLLGAIDYLRGRGFREFGLIGASQGGATVALAARELRDVKWVVLESVYPTLRDAVDRRFRQMFGVPGWLAGMLLVPMAEWRLGMSVNEVNPIERIGDFRCPVMFMHGDADRNTVPESARALFARGREPKSIWLVPGAGHVDLYPVAPADYESHLLEFIASATGERASVAQ
jgi:uncharacterized protein